MKKLNKSKSMNKILAVAGATTAGALCLAVTAGFGALSYSVGEICTEGVLLGAPVYQIAVSGIFTIAAGVMTGLGAFVTGMAARVTYDKISKSR